MKRIILYIISALIFASCSAPRPCVSMDDYNSFRYDVYRALDSLRHGLYDGRWEMR